MYICFNVYIEGVIFVQCMYVDILHSRRGMINDRPSWGWLYTCPRQNLQNIYIW